MRWVVLLLFLLPLASAEPGIQNPWESTPVTLWMHCDGLQDCPVTTSAPDWEGRPPSELLGHSQQCREVPVVGGVTQQDRHTTYGFHSPDGIWYEDEEPRYSPERGVVTDVFLDKETTPVFTWHVAVEAAQHAATHPGAAVAPAVVVTMTMREGDDLSIGHEAMDLGDLIMRGASETVTLHPQVVHPQVEYVPEGPLDIYRFTFPLEILADEILRDGSYNIRVDVQSDTPICDDPEEKVTLPTLWSHHGPDRWPSLHLAIMNPIFIEYLHPQFVGDDLVFHASITSPWGEFEPDGTSRILPTLGFAGPSQPVTLQSVPIARTHQHSGTLLDHTFTWIWPFAEEGALEGTYDVTLHAASPSSDAVSSATASFEIGSGAVTGCTAQSDEVICVETEGAPAETTPGFALWTVLVLLALLAKR